MSRRPADPRPVVLLPPSKGKAPGGEEPVYADVVDDGPLGPQRRRVLDAVVGIAGEADDAALTRIAGVAARDIDATRVALADLMTAPTMRARRRYTGVVHGNANLAGLAPGAGAVEVLVLSALLGAAGLEDRVPAYRLELAASLPPLGGLATFWRDAMADHLMTQLAGRQVLDLLPAVHGRAVAPEVRTEAAVHTIAFETPDGRAANAARTKVAKGRVVAQLLGPVGPGDPTGGSDTVIDLSPATLVDRLELGEGWQLSIRDERTLLAVYRG